MSTNTQATTPSSADQSRQRRSMVGAFIGTAIEWYDFYIFGTAAALVFGQVFYPDIAPGAALLASFATFWVGFLMRPIGGMVFGHFGDRLGRKNVLVITLILMGAATTMIGLLPTYAQIGVLAPILLVVLRGAQGFAVGGEWGGAVLLSTENARAEKRGFAGAWVQQGSPAGSILATLMFLLVGLLPDEQFLSWGWRVPFLLSAVLVIVGLVIRIKVEESKDFVEAKKQQKTVKAPILVALTKAPVLVALGVAASIMGIAMAYFNNTFLLAWTTGELGMDRQVILNILLGTAVLQFVWQPIAALIAERVGATRVMVIGLLLTVLTVPFLFMAISAASATFITIVLCFQMLGGTAYYALLANALAQAFPPHIRYSGISLSYQLCATLIGGSTPLIAQWILNSSDGNPWAVAGFYTALLLATIAGVIGLSIASRKRAERDGDIYRA
ncbi:MAG TPA: MHS family MFS transporter [Candidatus Agrococcus pullicola]|uniref:Putative proline/betaine transporter n=1 Tax=Candidatus Agrococcus pullicola TaxID=2838429 RepID=A0A9D1YVQ6_9MICO|nr:MHS family MFS transporter [Candidatus Agrococcus pullicola]